jgi:3alpha(or 20beta)-hydroxysteroid dehydrogenase
MGRLDGKVALISGGARGQGEAEARRFVREGARVVIGDVLDDDGGAVAASIGSACEYVHLDVASETDWDAAVAHTESVFGGLHVLVNNAGILGTFKPLTKVSLEDFNRVLAVNLTGTFLGMRAAAPLMTKSGGGSIVNISSIGGMWGLPMLGPYVASKFGVRGLTKTAALELGPKGIRVNSVHPGGIDTEMTRLGGAADNEAAVFYKRLPVRRMGTVDDVANLVLFLASDESSYSTGGEFLIEGGALSGDAAMLETIQ